MPFLAIFIDEGAFLNYLLFRALQTNLSSSHNERKGSELQGFGKDSLVDNVQLSGVRFKYFIDFDCKYTSKFSSALRTACSKRK